MNRQLGGFASQLRPHCNIQHLCWQLHRLSVQGIIILIPVPCPTPVGQHLLLSPLPHPHRHFLSLVFHHVLPELLQELPILPHPEPPFTPVTRPAGLSTSIPLRISHEAPSITSSIKISWGPFLRTPVSRIHVPTFQIQCIQKGPSVQLQPCQGWCERRPGFSPWFLYLWFPLPRMSFPALPTRQTPNCFSKLFFHWDR